MQIKKHFKRLVPVALALAILPALAAPAQAAPNTISLSLSNPAPGATGVNYTYLWSGYQTVTPVLCVRIEMDTLADGTGTLPTGADLTAATMAPGTYQTGTWTPNYTNAGSGVVVFNNASGIAPTGTAKNVVFGGIKNPTAAAGSNFSLLVTTYSGVVAANACSGSVLDVQQSVKFVTNPDTVVSVVVDPTLTFTVAGKGSACNSQAPTTFNAGSTATAVSLGRVTATTTGGGAQDLTVTTNAGGGFTVYARGTAGTDDMTDGLGNVITDHTGTNAAPAAFPSPGTSSFGYTTSDTGAGGFSVANTFGKLTNVDLPVLVAAPGITTETQCVGFQAGVATSTKAGLYTATVIYTATPVF
jgi:hypothetical protein